MSFAGFDLGGNFGYAVLNDTGNRLVSGVINLGKRTPKSLHTFQTHLYNLIKKYDLAVVGYEQVTFMPKGGKGKGGFKAVQAWGGYEAILWTVSYQYECDILPVHVGTLKKLATGSGRAEKEDMEVAAYTRWSHVPEDDNESDALWIAEYGRRKFLGEIK